MSLTAIIFYLFTTLTIGSAIVMVFSRKIVHSAFALMFTLIGIAALYVLLYADFVAATQLLVYVGGILVLLLFGIMLTTQKFTTGLKSLTINIVPATILSACVAGILIYVYTTTKWVIYSGVDRTETVADLGILLMHQYILPFQAVGVLLLIAIIGALFLAARRKRKSNE